MKTLTLNVLKKNRKYFAATVNGYKAKILIDENSNSLELGMYDLTVDDISIRTKYGTDVIYKLSCPLSDQKDDTVVALKTNFFNLDLIDECRKLGGRYDTDSGAWIFKSFVENEVDELDYLYNSELINVEIELNDDYCGEQTSFDLAGFVLADATGIRSGARVSESIAVIRGGFIRCGSQRNWKTACKANTVIRMQIPSNLLKKVQDHPACKELTIILKKA